MRTTTRQKVKPPAPVFGQRPTRQSAPPLVSPDPAPPGALPSPPPIVASEKRVHFHCLFPGARQVYLAGTFNEWNPVRSPFTSDGRGGWGIDLILPPGRYEYRFLVEEKWMDDPLAERYTMNPFGGVNAVIEVN